MDLALIVPTRGRPNAAFELTRTFIDTCTADTQLVFVVDEDDPKLDSYRTVPSSAIVTKVSTKGMVPALNHVATLLAQKVEAVGFMGDDHRPRTRGWDEVYLDMLEKVGTGIVYGNDLLQGENLPTQCAMTANIIRVLGYMAPPPLTHLYIDNFWRDLGAEADCLQYLPNVIIEHMHPLANKAKWDEGYLRVNDGTMYQADAEAYGVWKTEFFSDAVRKVKAL